MLTTAEAKAAQPGARGYKLHDGGGLHLFVAPTGAKSWRLRYRRQGREQLLTLGRFPEVPPAMARARCAEAKARIARGEAATPPRDVNRQVDTLAEVARAWHAHMAPRWSPAHAADVLASLERDVFPQLGSRPIGAIAAPELLNVMRSVEARGALPSARRLRQRLSALFGYAQSLGLCDSDPAARLGRAMQGATVARPMPALTAIEDCRALLAACDHIAGPGDMVALAARFLALTAVRLDAVRGMRWGEVSGLDGPEPVWTVPAARMKLARAKKDQARFDHVVPLSPAAVAVLCVLRSLEMLGIQDERGLSGYDAHSLVFARRPGVPIGENAIRLFYRRAGFAGRHVPHGWRASFSTIMNEALGPEWRDDIDRALAHSPKDKVEAAYNRSAQLARRRELFDRWGALLETRQADSRISRPG